MKYLLASFLILTILPFSQAQTFEFTSDIYVDGDFVNNFISDIYKEDQNELRLTVQETGSDACNLPSFSTIDGSLFVTGCGWSNSQDITKILTMENVDGKAFSPVGLVLQAAAYRPFDTSPYELTNMEIRGLDGNTVTATIPLNNLPGYQDQTILFADYTGFKDITKLQIVVYHQDLLIRSFTMSAPLPVTLISFSAHKENGVNRLYWSTSEEINAYNFEVEASWDAKNFKTIGVVATGGSQYEYTDLNINEKVYYRLKMNDDDGTFAYSRIIVADHGNKAEIQSLFYPNPASRYITVDMHMLKVAEVNAELVNMQGKVLLRQQLHLQEGMATIQLSDAVPSGSYILKVSNAQIQQNSKIVIK